MLKKAGCLSKMVVRHNITNTNINYDLGSIILLIMATAYPLLVIPGAMSYFYGPRFIFLVFISLFALIYNYYNNVHLKKPVYFAMFTFLFFATLATIFADDIMQAWVGDPRRFTGLSTYLCCAILFITARNIKDPEKILKAMIYGSVVVSIIAIMQHFGYNIVPHETFREGYHSYGTLGNPNFLGTYTVFLFPVSALFYIYQPNVKWLFTSILIFAALILSMTRGSWMAFAIIFIFITLHAMHKNKKLRRQWLILTISIIIVYFAFLIPNEGAVLNRTASIATEVESALEFEDRAGSKRMYAWKESVKLIPQNMALGVGPDNLAIRTPKGKIEDKALNHFLEIIVTMGIFALISYIIFLFYCFRDRRRDWLGHAMMLMVLAYLLQGQFNIDVIMNLPLFWIILGLMQSSTKVGEGALFKKADDKYIKEIDKCRTTVKKKYVLYILLIAIFIFIAYISSMLFITREGVIEIEGQGIYTGQIRGATFHGYGIWEMRNGSVYEGEFKNGAYDGYGTLTYINGSKYTGEFQEGYFHGKGKIITAEGRIVEGTWVKGRMVE